MFTPTLASIEEAQRYAAASFALESKHSAMVAIHYVVNINGTRVPVSIDRDGNVQENPELY